MYSSTLPSTSAVDGGGWLTPRPGRFTPERDPVPIVTVNRNDLKEKCGHNVVVQGYRNAQNKNNVVISECVLPKDKFI